MAINLLDFLKNLADLGGATTTAPSNTSSPPPANTNSGGVNLSGGGTGYTPPSASSPMLTFYFGSQGSSQDPNARWNDVYTVDSNGNLIYGNTNQKVGYYNFNTGELTNLNGQSMGRITTDANGRAVYTTEKGNVIPGYTSAASSSSSNVGSFPLTLTFGSQGSSQDPNARWSDVYTIDNQGNLVYQATGQVVGYYDFNTGTLTGLNGQSMGSIKIGPNGEVVYVTEKGNVIPGSYKTGVSNPSLLGTITYDGKTYQVVDDGSGYYQMYLDGSQVGYIQVGDDGFLNLYNQDGAKLLTVNPQDGSIFDAITGAPLAGTATFTDSSGAPGNPWASLQPEYRGTITKTNPDGSTTNMYLTTDGRVVDENGNTLYKYSQTGNYEFALFDLSGNQVGTYNTQTGAINYTDGTSDVGAYTPSGIEVPPYGDTTATTTGKTSEFSTSNVNQAMKSGIDWTSPVASALLPSVTETALNLPGMAETAGTQAQEKYVNLMNQAMGPQNFQGYLNALGARGVLDSSLTQSTLANAAQQTAQAIGKQAFDASLANTQESMKVPGYLSTILSQLGGTAGTTTGTTTGSSTSTTDETKAIHDPYAPWNTYVNLMNM